MDEQGLTDAAILLMALGADAAAEVFKHLSPKEVQQLGATMARMKTASRERIDEVLARYRSQASDHATLVTDSDEYVRSVLTRAMGEDKARLLIDRITHGSDYSGIESLKAMDEDSVAELLSNEHPQIVASVLVHLERDHAAGILSRLDERQRNDVVMRVATLDGIQPAALRELNDVLAKVLSNGAKRKRTVLGGTKTAAEIVNFLGGAVESAVLDAIREHDPDLAQKIADQMFTFADLMKLDDRAIQALLREVQSDSLVVALKGADPELREKVFRNMSTRAAETLREDLDSRGPVRVSEVEAEQKEILKTVRRLADEGQIQLAGGGGEDAFV